MGRKKKPLPIFYDESARDVVESAEKQAEIEKEERLDKLDYMMFLNLPVGEDIGPKFDAWPHWLKKEFLSYAEPSEDFVFRMALRFNIKADPNKDVHGWKTKTVKQCWPRIVVDLIKYLNIHDITPHTAYSSAIVPIYVTADRKYAKFLDAFNAYDVQKGPLNYWRSSLFKQAVYEEVIDRQPKGVPKKTLVQNLEIADIGYMPGGFYLSDPANPDTADVISYESHFAGFKPIRNWTRLKKDRARQDAGIPRKATAKQSLADAMWSMAVSRKRQRPASPSPRVSDTEEEIEELQVRVSKPNVVESRIAHPFGTKITQEHETRRLKVHKTRIASGKDNIESYLPDIPQKKGLPDIYHWVYRLTQSGFKNSYEYAQVNEKIQSGEWANDFESVDEFIMDAFERWSVSDVSPPHSPKRHTKIKTPVKVPTPIRIPSPPASIPRTPEPLSPMSRILEGIYTEEDMRLHDTYIATAAKNVLTQRMKIAKFHKAANPGKRVRDPDMPVRLQLGGNKTPNKHKRTGLSNRIRYGFNKGTVVKFMRRAGVRRANFKGGIYEDTVNALSSWFTEIKERMGPMIVYTTRHTRIFALQAMLYSIKTAKAVNVYINDDFMKEGEPLWVSKKYKYGDVPFDVHDPAREADPTWEPRSKRDAINPPL